MSNRIESFPMINEDIINELDINIKTLEAKYNANNIINTLEIIKDEEDRNEYILDNNGIWTNNIYNLHIIGEFEIANYNILFKENKIAEKDTILGVAVTYILPSSTKTYTKEIGEITYSQEDTKVMKFNLDFDIGELSPKIYLKFSIYVKEVNLTNNISIFAKNIGTVLGEIYDCSLIIEGQGSEFPIVIIEKQEGTLWDMEVNFESLDEIFSVDTICLKINRAHKDFTKLGIDKISTNNNLIWKEMLVSFFTNLFIVANEIENLDNIFNEEIMEGTVGSFLKIQLTQFNIEINELKNPITLATKIRKELDNLL